MEKNKRVLVDMSCTIIHHGHIRLLKNARKLGDVIVALTSDEEILEKKGYLPELNFEQRREILESICYVSEVIEAKWLIDDAFIISNKIDVLVHGDDNENQLSECELIILPRTAQISSSYLREKSYEIWKSKLG